MPEKYIIASAGAELISFSSVRFGKGTTLSTVQEWFTPCSFVMNGTTIPGIYGNPEISAVYETFTEVTSTHTFG